MEIAVCQRLFDHVYEHLVGEYDRPQSEDDGNCDKKGDKESYHFGLMRPTLIVRLRRPGLSNEVLMTVFFMESAMGEFSIL